MTPSRRTTGVVTCLLLGALACRPFWTLPDPKLRYASVEAVEVRFESPGGLVVVPVRLGDDPTVWHFVVDTEQLATLVSPTLAAGLGLRPRHVRHGYTYYGAYRDWVPIVPLPSLWIADVELRGGKAEVVDLDALSQQLCQPIDGVFGLKFPQHLVYEIDYAASVLRFARSLDHLPVRGGGVEPNNIDLVTSDASSAFGADVASTYPGTIEVTERRHHGAITQPRREFAVWPAAMIDEASLDRSRTKYGSHHLDMRLGARVLQAYIVRRTSSETLLYPNGRTLPRGPLSFGFTWSLDGGEATITDLHASTRALGLALDAKILAIDDQPLASLTPMARCLLHRDWETGRDSIRVTLDTATIRGTPEEEAAARAAGPTLTLEIPRRKLFTPQ